ncbi:cupin domain-containing protein [Oceanobacillus kimchii]|uniref:cupin domain-containing protein n=1 Tax=Oceanobacillus kimchii TaxID=746691 RepID=UPI0021A8BA1F|nr:cupin domain-containing protein [Oceanobacillus kimchii]MCT1575717.1 cupin domain-containing protein [Oceanobacillus kimchii]MCT2135354.1 cupin domain-containing protein [Oceanobacillus kimchii]
MYYYPYNYYPQVFNPNNLEYLNSRSMNSYYYPQNHYNTQYRITDQGPNPFVFNIEEATNINENYRTTIWTGEHSQVTLMSINVGDDIGLEIHPHVDQFLRVEEGEGIARMGKSRDNLTYQRRVGPGSAVIVPAGTWHDVVNVGSTPLKLYAIYSPPEHPKGTIHHTKADAIESGT